MRSTTRFRELIARGPAVAPSVFDCLSARLAERAGFEAVHLAGSGVEAALLGAPDLGLLSMTEFAAHAARVAAAVNIPVIADIDSGFGGVLNIQRTIRELERAGVAGVHLEDQASPKACPFLDGRKVVGRTAALDRLKAALDARQDPDFVIIARTDADVVSDAEVVERCNLFLENGADMAFPIFLSCAGESYYALSPARQAEVLRRIPQQIDGPVMYMGAPPPQGMSLFDVADAGWRFVLNATACFGAAANAMAAVLAEVRETGSDRGHVRAHPGPYHDGLEYMRLFHLDAYVETERRFTTHDR
jgi:2-methylisocitrate lyase-like PEP mutase family enzyme